jgi:hypothetical protein
MATAPRAVENQQTAGQAPPAKQKRKRSPSVAKPAFFVIQVMDENGQPQQFDKKRIRIVSVERSAEQVMELTESGDHPYAFYLRGIVPVQRTANPRSNPAQSQAAE